MPEIKRNALGSHPALYPAASKGLCQVEQILKYHFFGKIPWISTVVINKKITKL